VAVVVVVGRFLAVQEQATAQRIQVAVVSVVRRHLAQTAHQAIQVLHT
jgi:hypothetical protein